jgi:AI-2 transport protein TqsA
MKVQMTAGRRSSSMLALCAAVLVIASLYAARSIFAPIAFSLFIIAIVWPIQRTLQARMPRLLALAITTLITALVVAAAFSLVVWGVSRAGQWMIANGARLQALYMQGTDWLEGHGLYAAGLLTEQFNVGWLIRLFQEVIAGLRSIVTFALVTLVFMLLGLLEIDASRGKLEDLKSNNVGQLLLEAAVSIAAKLQRYMLVRSLMSAMTGALVSAFSYVAGLDLWLEWGVIAFALNYIPFIGPLIATVLPTFFAIAQFESWQVGVIVFFGMNLIQFIVGSYIEPRIAGTALSISPFMVLFAVFFWSFLWGLAGAFIGVPILIAFVGFCEQHPSCRWIAHLLSGGDRKPR